ncbi:MAG: CopG family antitoxin [Candidatus Sumerlaeaceae bacterium]
MREHYDFSRMKARKNPYVKLLKQPVTIRLDREAVQYFKELATQTGIPYQNLINMYLRDCAMKRLRPNLSWKPNNNRQEGI